MVAQALAVSPGKGTGTMHDVDRPTPWTMRRGVTKATLYHELARELDALLTGEPDPIANAANAAAAIYYSLPDLNPQRFDPSDETARPG
jgi:putative methionine-R-sulfoxide reductase with GAF domain